jgi:uncharacterized phage protein gp47/JayE
MATYPLATLAATVTAAGISAPPYSDVYESLRATFRLIYGNDAYIDPDSQDGQLLAVFAKAISDCNDAAIAVWNKFAPSTATGDGLSSQVKINGIARAVATKGSVAVRVVGVIGTVIQSGIVADDAGHRWLLPPTVTIPSTGQADALATAEAEGAVDAPAGTVTRIVNPQRGWQSATNIAAASAGAPVETDAALRRRQKISTALPSRTVLQGTEGALANLAGVTQVRVYENDTKVADANGLPGNSISAVVLGGDAAAIAAAILARKTPGAYTHGSTAVTVVGDNGLPSIIRFWYAGATPLSVVVTVKALPGYTTAVGDRIKQSIADYINGLGIGRKSDLGKIYLPAQFYGAAGSEKFEVDGVLQAAKPLVPTAADVAVSYNSRATIAVADITVNVT